jgi:hypothetical protein
MERELTKKKNNKKITHSLGLRLYAQDRSVQFWEPRRIMAGGNGAVTAGKY